MRERIRWKRISWSIVAVAVDLTACAGPLPPAPACPPGMAFVSGGAFLSGSSRDELDLADMGIKLGFVPRAPDFIETDDFCMDRFEYPNQAGALPRASVTFPQAQEACRAQGKRLCTEVEFERACGGLDAWHEPYGPTYVPGRCNTEAVNDVGNSARWLARSGAFRDCVSPEGIFDLDGNLSEWVDQGISPQEWESDQWPRGAVRGGTMWLAIYGSGCQARHYHYAFGPTSSDDGFRCCLDVPKARDKAREARP